MLGKNTGNRNTGTRNSGDQNSGNQNTGDQNTGYRNSGTRNSGNQNTGDQNAGNRNSGTRNTGYRNSGDQNAGNRNTGNRNAGNRNTGNRNTGNRNTGYLNTKTPTKGLLFNKEAELWNTRGNLIIPFPNYFFFDYNSCELNWIETKDMTDKEKKNSPEHKTTGGFLKITKNEKDLKYRWKKSFDKASHEDIMKTLDLPNFDADVFEEISGISLHKYQEKKATITISVMGEEKEFKNKQELKDYIDSL